MLRLLLLLALLPPGVAAADRILVVSPPRWSARPNDDRDASHRMLHDATVSALSQWGARFDVVSWNTVTTAEVASGTAVVGGERRDYDGVVVIFKAVNHRTERFAPDSLTLSACRLSVPVLFLGVDGDFQASSACSTGFQTTASLHGFKSSLYPAIDPTLRVVMITDEAEQIRAANAAGPVRVLIGARMNANRLLRDADTRWLQPTWPDSLVGSPPGWSAGGVDTAMVWELQKSHLAGSRPLVLCEVAHYAGSISECVPLLFGLARLDSLTGGAVVRRPIQVAVQVRKGFTRNQRWLPGGLSPDDSSAFKVALGDSIAALGFPFTVGVRMDSLGPRADEQAWWELASPQVRYAPELDLDALASAANAEAAIRSAHLTLERRYPGRVSRSLMARDFDLVPSGCERGAARDSLLDFYASFFRNVVVNPRYFRSWPHAAGAGNLAWFGGQPRYRTNRGWTRVVMTPGYPDSGSAGGVDLDTDHPPAGAAWREGIEMLWRGVLEGRWWGGYAAGTITAPTPDSLCSIPLQDLRILTIHAGDLGSGIEATWRTRPSRPGWQWLRHLWTSCRIAQRLAWPGHTPIAIVRDDEL